MNARAALLTLLLEMMPLMLLPLALNSAEAAESAALLTVALMCAWLIAVSVRSPAASTFESRM
jgi:hypothetical protein